MDLLAALIFFTRLPLGKIANVPPERFKRVVVYWPLVGWLTGGILAGTLWVCTRIFPMQVAVLVALIVRVGVTGALHEDGLADFCDGFGGGTSREKILCIMKDSRIGTYGVIGLVTYFGLLWATLSALPVSLACVAVLGGDAWSKCCAAQTINVLPYARKEEEAKAKVMYNRMDKRAWLFVFAAGVLPTILLLDINYWWATLASVGVSGFLITRMRKRIQGYTGDCCGASFLLCELAYYLFILLIYTLS